MKTFLYFTKLGKRENLAYGNADYDKEKCKMYEI